MTVHTFLHIVYLIPVARTVNPAVDCIPKNSVREMIFVSLKRKENDDPGLTMHLCVVFHHAPAACNLMSIKIIYCVGHSSGDSHSLSPSLYPGFGKNLRVNHRNIVIQSFLDFIC